MTEEKKKPERRKRMKGKSLGDLRVKMKCLERSVNSLNSKRDEILDAHDAFKDQIQWSTGILYDSSKKVGDQVVWGEKIGRITKDEEKAQRRCLREMEKIDSELGDLLWMFAEKLGCIPRDIDTTSGEIKGTPVDSFDPDSEEDVKTFRGESPKDASAEPKTEDEGDEGPIPFPMAASN